MVQTPLNWFRMNLEAQKVVSLRHNEKAKKGWSTQLGCFSPFVDVIDILNFVEDDTPL